MMPSEYLERRRKFFSIEGKQGNTSFLIVTFSFTSPCKIPFWKFLSLYSYMSWIDLDISLCIHIVLTYTTIHLYTLLHIFSQLHSAHILHTFSTVTHLHTSSSFHSHISFRTASLPIQPDTSLPSYIPPTHICLLYSNVFCISLPTHYISSHFSLSLYIQLQLPTTHMHTHTHTQTYPSHISVVLQQSLCTNMNHIFRVIQLFLSNQ